MSTPQPSPLGRYDHADAGHPAADREEQLHEVRLLRTPVRLLAAGRAHHDELMHELALLGAASPGIEGSPPRRLTELVDTLGRRYAAATRRPDALLDQALADGVETLDVTYQVSESVVRAADELEALMDEADEFCRSERLLTLPRPPLLREVAHWYLNEFRRQIAGEPPQPWTGPLDL